MRMGAWTEIYARLKASPAPIRLPLQIAWRFLLGRALEVRAISIRSWNAAVRLAENIGGLMAVAGREISHREARRVLGIYHFQEHAGYLGDMVEFLAILNVIRLDSGLEKIDLCFVDDPSNPNQPVTRDRVENVPGYKEMMIELRALLPNAGATFFFDSDAGFERFFRRHLDRYVPWPQYRFWQSWPSVIDYGQLPAENGIPYPNTFAPFRKFHERHGHIPPISCPEADLEWARQFLRSNVNPRLPIALQLRINPDSSYRDTQISAWKEFLARMEPDERFMFVIVSRKEEVLPELRELRNVVFAKDHGSTMLQDIALIQISHFSMFPAAGFVTFPWFCGLPSIKIATELYKFPYLRMGAPNGEAIPFLTKYQRRKFGPYDADTIESEFRSLLSDLEAIGWRNPYVNG